MPSSRTVPTNETIHTFGAAGFGRTYTSLATWETDTTINLVSLTQSRTLVCYADAASYNQTVTVAGATTNSTYRRQIRSASGQGYDGIPGHGVVLSVTSDNHCVLLSDANTDVLDLSFQIVSSSTNGRVGGRSTNSNTAFIGCLAYDSMNSGTGAHGAFQGTVGGLKLINCLAKNVEEDAARLTDTTSLVSNCTFIGNLAAGVRATTAPIVAINTLSHGNTGADFMGTFDAASKNNASEDATAPGTNSRTNQTFTFVNAAGNNYHLASSDTGAKGFGFDQSALYDDDVDGQVITTWSIGFDSHASGAVNIAPDAATATATALNPGVVLGSITYAPAQASVASTSIDPLVRHGSISISPAAAVASASAVNPTIRQSSVSVSPAHAAAAALAISPSVIMGSVSLSPTGASTVCAAPNPTVGMSSVFIVPDPSSVAAHAMTPETVGGIALPELEMVQASGVIRRLLTATVER